MDTLKAVLEAMEDSNSIEDNYANESLKRVEINIKNLRKSLKN
jgi:hypothetical protein